MLMQTRNFKVYSPIDAYLFDNTTDFNAFLSNYTPPTVSQIFNTWGRFSANAWFPSGTTPTGDAAAWQYNSTLNRIECTLNTATFCGFISTEKLDNYTLEATLSSTNTDDDLIGLVAAFKNDGTNNTALLVVRTNEGVTPNWGFYLVGSANAVLLNASRTETAGFKNTTYSGWVTSGVTRVKVQRSGNIVSAWCSTFGSTSYVTATLITFDLTSDSRTAVLTGKQSYGYAAYSQLASTFTDISLTGALSMDTAYDTASNTIKKYSAGAWTTQAGSINTSLGYPRYVTNPYSGITFFINRSGVISRV